MPTEHPVRISGPDDAPPETAAIRLIALLPKGWRATVLDCHDGTATLRLTVPDGLTPPAVDRTLDDILANPVLRGWTKA
ncbi:hypothetical protein ABZ606_16660 [Streptomyces sp. NPDC012461]|jgi:hypothetical protein|uniref:Uncharacterized protein n=2 Tax=unclassified Streptomyces TaxID=2593676 RepID=A0A6G3R3A0_9ACTN|nr:MULTISPECIES: hypothetical protein [unclassified Streptomyces]MBM7089002.1 hypothetical protein [Streptomyces sp. S12]NEA90229.1 hypothetical protein [Streptomyces sp. SID14436]NEC28749.1 hypothetical protein [Streptomyces sp. SID8111]NEC79156.1 hypothetical protein [Streptomyces sp. SID7958]NED20744.1 hypothetical protein [Streptomyces sp. SID9913]